MAFSNEELEIIKKGKELGKSRDEVVEAITRFRSGERPQAPVVQEEVAVEKPETGLVEGIKQDFGTRVESAADAQVSAIAGEQDVRSATLQTIGQGAGFVGDIFMRSLSAITPDFIKEKLSKGVEAVAETETVQDVAQKYSDWKLQNPEKAANLEAVANLASILPVGAVGAKGAQAVTKGALIGTGKAIESTASVLGGIGTPIKGAGTYLYKSAVTPTAQEAKKILEYRAKTPFLTRVATASANEPLTRGKTALEQGLMGTESAIGVQARQKADDLWSKEIVPAVRESDVTMTKDELFTPALERIAAIEDPTRKKAMQDAYDALLEDYADYPNEISLEKAQALKRDLAKFTPQKIFKGQDVASELRTLQADMAGAIRQKTYTALKDENIKKKYLDWANLDELTQIGVKAISEQKFKAGSGTLVGGLWDSATVPIKTIGGQVLYRVGDMLEFEAPKGLKTFGQYLQQKGYAKPTEYSLPESEAGLGLSMKASISPEQKLQVAKALESYDTSPQMVTVGGKKYIDTSASERDFRLMQLQEKNNRGTFTDADALEAQKLLQEGGVLERNFKEGEIPTTKGAPSADTSGGLDVTNTRNQSGVKDAGNLYREGGKFSFFTDTIEDAGGLRTINTLDDAKAEIAKLSKENPELQFKAEKNKEGTYSIFSASNPNPLYTEARKYKSAEEFVKAQGTPVYHGTDAKFDVFDLSKRGVNEQDFQSKNAFFFTDSLDTAKSYGENIQQRYAKFEKPLIIDAKGEMYSGGASEVDMKQVLRDAVEQAKRDGNDVVIVKNLSDRKDWGNYEPATHYAVIDTTKLYTKEELIKIWQTTQE